MPRKFKANDKKFGELILYISSRSEDDPTFSATKLNKILFFVDFLAFKSLGRPITGHRYQKLPNGPAPIAFLPVVGRMVERGECEWSERDYFGKRQRRLLAHRGANMSSFTDEELALINHVLESLWEESARQVSDLSHRFPGWQAVPMQTEIPYETVFVLPSRPLTRREVEHGQALARS